MFLRRRCVLVLGGRLPDDGFGAVRPLRRQLTAHLGDCRGHFGPDVDQLVQLSAEPLDLLTGLLDLLLDPSRVALDQVVGLLRRRTRQFDRLVLLGCVLIVIAAWRLGHHRLSGCQTQGDHQTQTKTRKLRRHGVDSKGDFRPKWIPHH